MISYAEALEKIQTLLPIDACTMTPLEECLGRVLARDIHALVPSPAFTNSAMDGFAYRHASIQQAEVTITRTLYAAPQSAMITDPGVNHVVRIMTGAPLPPWADTVIPVESCTMVDDQRVRLDSLPEAGANVRRVGEDMEAGELLVPAGTRLDPERLLIAANFGHGELPTLAQPAVCVISTGDELQDPGSRLEPGAIYNSTRIFLGAALQAMGIKPTKMIQIKDQTDLLKREVQSFLDQTTGPRLVLTTGAVSAGEKDFIPVVAREMGFAEIFHKVAVRPGKPLLLAKKSNDVLWLGIPGNPVSTATTWHYFIRPLLNHWAKFEHPGKETVQLKQDIKKPLQLRCFYRGIIGNDGKVDIPSKQASAHLRASIQANAYVELPEGRDLIPAGEKLLATRIGNHESN